MLSSFQRHSALRKARHLPEPSTLHLPSTRASQTGPRVYATGTFKASPNPSIPLHPPSEIPLQEEPPSHLSCQRSLANTNCCERAYTPPCWHTFTQMCTAWCTQGYVSKHLSKAIRRHTFFSMETQRHKSHPFSLLKTGVTNVAPPTGTSHTAILPLFHTHTHTSPLAVKHLLIYGLFLSSGGRTDSSQC